MMNAVALEGSFPGGSSRKSMRLHFEGDKSVIATRRKRPGRSQMEATVLRKLGARGVAVPGVLGFDGEILLQEDLGGVRLPLRLNQATAEEGEKLLGAALDGLAAAHRAASRLGLRRRVPVIGGDPEWIAELVDRPARIGAYLGLPAVELPVPAMVEHLRIRRPRFIKWDARPGNALCLADGRIAWIDWEHCGARNRLDDMAWLLADEFVPEWPDAEDRLIADRLAQFADGQDDAADYLATFGTFHMSVRLGIILRRKKGGEWWDGAECLANDYAGVTRECATRVARRAARWAERSRFAAELAPCMRRIAERVAELD